jgi:hypothetical protein
LPFDFVEKKTPKFWNLPPGPRPYGKHEYMCFFLVLLFTYDIAALLKLQIPYVTMLGTIPMWADLCTLNIMPSFVPSEDVII